MNAEAKQPKDGFSVLVLLAIILSICVLSTFCSSCKTKYITTEVPVVVHERDSIYKINTLQIHDTLMMRDSVYHYVKGDTTIIERWHQLQAVNHISRIDTVTQIQYKEVPVTITKTETVEVEKKLSWFQKLFITLGKIVLGIFGIWGVWKIIKWKKLI